VFNIASLCGRSLKSALRRWHAMGGLLASGGWDLLLLYWPRLLLP
jgi:hypothetical protein